MNNAPQLHIGPSSEVVDALYKGLPAHGHGNY